MTAPECQSFISWNSKRGTFIDKGLARDPHFQAMKEPDFGPGGNPLAGNKGITRARLRARRNMAQLAQGWDELEDWERDEWWKRAMQHRVRTRRKMTPWNLGKPRTRAMRGEEI